jgi:hypothetical protein
VSPGSAAIVAPGTLHALRCEDGAALRLVLVPARGVPVHILGDASRREIVIGTNVSVWL